MKNIIGFLLSIFCSLAVSAQTVYELDANIKAEAVRSEHLHLGGSNPAGDKISVNNFYLAWNGKPFIPVVGEFHYPRYPAQYWDESIKKMKAGGINVVATYVFWNIHEEKEGTFKWSGTRDLRQFLELCAKNDMKTIVRIGPFCHGEIRNGGLPDWLLGKPLTIRSNDPVYLACVERFYTEIGKQLQGLYFKDGGNIIGIQIENEYQHSAAPWGLMYPGQAYDWTAAEHDLASTHSGVSVASADNPYAALGDDHMKILKSLAVKAGMDVPLYTATGWGYAAIVENESLPVTSAYAYPFWTEKKDLSPFFLYKDLHSFPDYLPVRYKPKDYLSFSAELGSGIMSVYTRRPIVEQKSMDALVNRCLGSGTNGLGYYMFHGGSTPRGEQYFYADEAYGLPKVSYDFQAPIGEFGQLHEGFHRLKLVHYFLQDFGDLLAPMQVALPKTALDLKPENLKDLRYTARVKDGAGFLFLNNFQDDAVMEDQHQVQIKLALSTGTMSIPESGGFDLESSENAILPFNFDLNGAKLNYATAQLLLKTEDSGQPCFIFFAPEGIRPEFSFAKNKKLKLQNNTGCEISENQQRYLLRCPENAVSEFSVISAKGAAKVLVVPKAMALKSWKVLINGKKHLIFSDAAVLQYGETFELHSSGQNTIDFSIYPASKQLPVALSGASITSRPGYSPLNSWLITLPPVNIPVITRQIGPKKFTIKMPETISANLSDFWLTVDYIGDTAMGFLDGELVTDEFYKGIPWQIGLRKFYPAAAGKEMVFYFRPMQKGATYLPDLLPESVPDFGDKKEVLSIKNWRITPEYRFKIQF